MAYSYHIHGCVRINSYTPGTLITGTQWHSQLPHCPWTVALTGTHWNTDSCIITHRDCSWSLLLLSAPRLLEKHLTCKTAADAELPDWDVTLKQLWQTLQLKTGSLTGRQVKEHSEAANAASCSMLVSPLSGGCYTAAVVVGLHAMRWSHRLSLHITGIVCCSWGCKDWHSSKLWSPAHALHRMHATPATICLTTDQLQLTFWLCSSALLLCRKERKGNETKWNKIKWKTTPFSIILMRGQVLYQAAQVLLCIALGR